MELVFRKSAESKYNWWLCTRTKSGKIVELETVFGDTLFDFLGKEAYDSIKNTPAGDVVTLKAEQT